MKKVIMLLMVFLCGVVSAQGFITKSDSENRDETRKKVERAVLDWATASLDDFNEPRFEKYHADYTDEYTMAKLREKSLDDNIARLERQKEKGTYNGSEEDYRKAMEVLLQRKSEAAEALKDFHPKVKNYTLSFWANVRLDSGVYNYIEFKMVVDDYFNVTSHEVISQIGDNKNAKIVYKTKD
jgi:hypothetical protein